MVYIKQLFIFVLMQFRTFCADSIGCFTLKGLQNGPVSTALWDINGGATVSYQAEGFFTSFLERTSH